MKKLANNLWKAERGQTLVEMALLLPFLLLLIFGIIDFGRVFNSYLTVTSASREAARTAALRMTDTQIIEAARQAARTLPGALAVTINPLNTRVRGNPVTVTVSYDVPILTPVIQAVIADSWMVTGATTMRVE